MVELLEKKTVKTQLSRIVQCLLNVHPKQKKSPSTKATCTPLFTQHYSQWQEVETT